MACTKSHRTSKISQDLEGIGPVRAYFVDVEDLGGPTPAATGSLLARTTRQDPWARRPRPAVHAGPAAPASHRFRSLIPPLQSRWERRHGPSLQLQLLRLGRRSQNACGRAAAAYAGFSARTSFRTTTPSSFRGERWPCQPACAAGLGHGTDEDYLLIAHEELSPRLHERNPVRRVSTLPP